MPRTTIYEAKTERLQILDKDGKVDKELMPELSKEDLVGMYRLMYRMRSFDQKGLNLQRQGRMGTWGSLQGQEACQAGLATSMTKQDWLVPSFREHGVMEAIGIPMHLIYAFWKGDERGTMYDRDVRCLPPAVPVGSQLQHATGIGLAFKKKGEEAAAVGCAGDGASSEGDFHEALNFAGVYGANTIFFIQNNQWAISVPFKMQTASDSIAQKAHAYGIDGIQVDGNDILAVIVACREALEKARSGGGPTLIEALTYRLKDHTTADDASRYRKPEEVEHWEDRDPLKRLRILLEKAGFWDDSKQEIMEAEVDAEVESEVEALEDMDPPDPSDMFDYMYAKRPWNLDEQRELLMSEVNS